HPPRRQRQLCGWRNVPSHPQRTTYATRDGEITVAYRLTRAGLVADGHDDVTLVDAAPGRVVLDVAGVRRAFTVARHGDGTYVDSPLGPVALTAVARFPTPVDQVPPGSLLAPMPGTVVRVDAAPGDAVTAGQPLMWLEAMKMQHRIDAPADGVLTELSVAVGRQVDVGTVLAVVTGRPADSTGGSAGQNSQESA
ncbi:acetyl-CoA carboxylase biotin carboxyl carrier protein subunit, partial [Streptomyces specialis]|uniref:acetyl-CoA carboxylase biotin carboxyl carrier protein subunit n=1 Tax=Streptomyces specialis TaxID=498367 RepID=UPI000AB9BF95